MSTRARPGVLSRFLGWVSGLPAGGWWFYPLLYGLVFVLPHVALWATGQLPVGSIHPLLAVGAFYAPYVMAAIAWINRSSGRAVDAFWPATGWPDEDRELWRRRLVDTPDRWDVPAVALGLAVAIIGLASASPAAIGDVDRAAILAALLPSAVLGYVIAPLAIIHSAYQLRTVARIHREATMVDPFDRVSLYAFSSLTARTGVAYVVIGYYGVTANGAFQEGNIVALLVLVAVFAIGLACFVFPLWGIHDRLVKEKEALIRDVELRLSRLSEEIYRRIDAGQFDATKVVSDALGAVSELRKRIDDVPTWPWRPRVLSGFISALLLPVAIYLITRAVANQLGA